MTEKENLEKEYIIKFEKHFIMQKLDINNSQEIEYIKETITNILKLEMEELGYKLNSEVNDGEKIFSINFINEPNLSYDGRFREGNNLSPDQIEINIFTIFKDLSSDNREIRENRCLEIFATIFHEVQHKRQRILTRLNIGDKYSMLYAKELVLQEIIGKEFYGKKSYNSIAIEDNANLVGYGKLYYLMSQFNPDFLFLLNRSKLFEADLELDKYENERNKKSHFNSKDGIAREDFFEQLVLEGISDQFLDRYSILKKEYRSQKGTIKRRNSIELIKNLIDEVTTINSIKEISEKQKNILIKSIKEVYYQMIYRSMKKEMPIGTSKFYEKIRDNAILNFVGNFGIIKAKRIIR